MKKTTKEIRKDKKFWADPMCYPVFTDEVSNRPRAASYTAARSSIRKGPCREIARGLFCL